jgi:hypothetical protein
MPPGEQGKGQGFAVAVADAQLGEGAQRQAAAAPPQLRHQRAVAGASAGHQ